MPVKIRLQRKGRRKRPFYHIVIADSRAPRDGRFIEKIGTYNPMTNPATIELDRDAAFDWLQKGAQPTNTVRAILRFNGVLFRKHLQRGVAKGAMTQEEADKHYAEWTDAKDSKTAERFEATAKAKINRISKISGTPPPPPKVEEPAPAEEAVEQTVEAMPETAETAPAAEPAVVDAPEAVTPAEEAPAAEDSAAIAANEAAPEEAKDIAGEAEATEEAAEAVAEALEENPQGAEDVAPEADGDKKEEA